MANRFYSPNQQFADATGLPYANGTLAFYASGTSTPLTTYSDSALTIANTNPVSLDSAGRAGNIFLQNLAYKVVLSDSNSNPIWTDDPVYSSDYSARAKLTTGSGSPNGSVAGTAGSPGIGADTYWDSTNNVLYVCTTTGTTSTAVWTAVNAAQSGSVVPQPQGYLTTGSNTPVITNDAIASSVVYYTPYVGNLIPLYNGSSFQSTVFTQLILTLSGQSANTIYDVFGFSNAGAVAVAAGPAWAGSAQGSGSRGSGAGTTSLALINGLWVNSVSMTASNGSSSYTIPANQGTYLGSLFIDPTPGTVTCHRNFGQSRRWGVWNCYNRLPLYLKAGDTSATWLAGGSLGPANGNTANSLTTFVGLAEEVQNYRYASRAVTGTVAATTSSTFQVGVGLNNPTAAAGRLAQGSFLLSTADMTYGYDLRAEHIQMPALPGINVITALERNPSSGATNVTVAGTEGGSVLIAQWMG